MLPLLAMQCKKDKNKDPEPVVCMDGDTLCELSKLPPITTIGANTFGCLLNGKAWLAYSDAPGKRYLFADYYKNAFDIMGRIYDENGILIEVIGVSSYDYQFDIDSIQIVNQDKGKGKVIKYSDNCFFRGEYEFYEGHMEVLRLDTINRIVSVTFEFTHIIDRYNLAHEFCDTDTNYITHGRADILFKL
jgi:hypothetical protein